MKKNILPIIIIFALLFSQSCSNSNVESTSTNTTIALETTTQNTTTNTTAKNTTSLASENTQNANSSDINSTKTTSSNDLTPQYRKITPEEAENMMKSGNKYILLDVRTEEEFKEKRIDGAILIPDTEISAKVPSELPDKNALILVYCRSGKRSEKSSKDLVNLGYTNVYDFGGLNDWPYETVSN